MKTLIGAYWICFILAQFAEASPSTLTYQGRILKSDGNPFEYNQTKFNFQVTGPDGPYSNCVIYDEIVSGVDMTNSAGMFDVSIGSSHSFPSGPSFTILDAFNNANSFYCEGGSTTVPGYVASPSDGRKLRVRFYDGTSWEIISPDAVIRSVPYAAYSLSAQKLGNFQATDFTLKPSFPTCASGSFLTWDAATGFGCTSAPTGGGTTAGDASYSAKGLVQFDTSAMASGMTFSSSGIAKVNVGTGANQIVALDGMSKLPAVDGSALLNVAATSFSGSLLGDVSGTQGATSVDKIKGKAVILTTPTNGQVLQYNGTGFVNATLTDSDSFAAVSCLDGYVLYKSAGTWACLPASSSNVLNSLISRNGSGAFAAGSADLNSVILRDGSTAGTITLSVPTGFTAYNLVLPSTSGTTGQILGKASGNNLQWMSLSASDLPTAAGDVSGGFSALSVDKLKGRSLDTTAPTVDGQIYSWDTTTTKWKMSSAIAPTNGQVLKWNSVSKSWEAGTVTSGTDTLGGMSCTSGQLPYYNGSAWSCETQNTANSNNTIVQRNGSGVSEFSGVALANGTTNVTMAAATAGSAYTLTWPSNLPASNGMVLSSTTAGALSWVSALTSALPSTNIFIGNAGGVATAVSMSGDATISSAGALTIANNAITNAKVSASAAIARSKLATGTANGILLNDSSGNMTDLACGTSGQVPTWNGSAWVCAIPSTLPSLASAKIWVGNGSSVATAITPSGDVTMTNAGAFTVTKVNNLAPTTSATANSVLQLDASGLATTLGENIKGSVAGQVQLRAPSSLTTYTLTLPTTAGSNGQFLQTNGSGTLSWGSVSTGAVVVKSTDFSVATTENNYTYIVSGIANVALPAAATAGAGFQVTFKNNSAGTVAVVANAGEYIDGGAQANLTSTNQFMKVITDGTAWYIVSGSASITALTCISGSQTFNNIGADQTLAVSAANAIACRYSITVKGAGGSGSVGGTGGGISISSLKLSAAGTFNIRVGAKGISAAAHGGTAFGGGGSGGDSTYSCNANNGGGGGGSSVVFGSTLLAVAGGGGGGGSSAASTGGNGGSGTALGTAGTAGSNAAAGNPGASNVGGTSSGTWAGAAGGGSATITTQFISTGGAGYFNGCAGGGGGGYGGGGGGGSSNGLSGGGGGGGGGYVNSTAVSSGAATASDVTGSAVNTDGQVVITWN